MTVDLSGFAPPAAAPSAPLSARFSHPYAADGTIGSSRGLAMVRPIGVLLSTLTLLVSGCTRRDLGVLCDSAKEAVTEPNVTRQRTRLGILVAGQVTKTGKVRAALDDLEFLDPPAKYPALKASIARLGHPEWSCPELEKILSAPDEDDLPAADPEPAGVVDGEAAAE